MQRDYYPSFEEASSRAKKIARYEGVTIKVEREDAGFVVIYNSENIQSDKEEELTEDKDSFEIEDDLDDDALYDYDDATHTRIGIQWFEDAELVLLKLIANIMQTSHKNTSRLANAVIAKTTGLAGASGVLGLISTFGSASTGTAIAGLGGAAASNATFYWLGSIVGGGVAAGTVITGGIGIISGYYGLKWWKGNPRKPEHLTEEENRIIESSLGLIRVFREQIESEVSITKEEAKLLEEGAWNPLLNVVREYYEDQSAGNLNLKSRIAVSFRVDSIKELSYRLSRWNEWGRPLY